MSVRDDILAYLRAAPGGSFETISEDLIQTALDDLHAAGEITEYGGWYRAANVEKPLFCQSVDARMKAGRKLRQQQTALTINDVAKGDRHGC